MMLAAEAEAALAQNFAAIDKVAYENTCRVMEAFKEERVSDACFAGTTGYGYDDRGREVLDRVWAVMPKLRNIAASEIYCLFIVVDDYLLLRRSSIILKISVSVPG